jgi:hypothetical protein
MRYLSFLSLFYFVGSFLSSTYAAPFTVPYRYPTRYEVTYNRNITVSSQPITESDIFIEQGVIKHLINTNFLRPRYLIKWNRLNQLTVLNPIQAIRMMRLKRRQANALRKFQRANGLPQTGIIDTPVIRIVFPITCGTPDYVDEPNDGFGNIDDYDDGASNTTAPADSPSGVTASALKKR